MARSLSHTQRHAVEAAYLRFLTQVPPGTLWVFGYGSLMWSPDGTPGDLPSKLSGVHTVINLAGEGIADRRWTAARKEAIRESRVLATRTLVSAMAACKAPPRVFISSSAVGYYGPHGDEPVTEAALPGSDFLARVCVEWEQEARAAESDSTRVVLLRTGLPLSPDGGACVADAMSDPNDPSGYSRSDLISQGFIHTPELRALVDATTGVADLDVHDFDAIVVAGGQAPMFTFERATALQRVFVAFYEAGKVAAALCHGTAVLAYARGSDGEYIVKGKTVTGFANVEEDFADNAVWTYGLLPRDEDMDLAAYLRGRRNRIEGRLLDAGAVVFRYDQECHQIPQQFH